MAAPRDDRAPGNGTAKRAEEFELHGTVGHLLRRCQQRAVDLFAAEVGEDGLTPRQFAVLLSVYQSPGINQTDLVRLSGIDRSTLTEIVRRLVARGFISRTRQPNDQRTNTLSITEAGEAALKATIPAVGRAQERILAPLAPGDRAAALSLLARLAGLGEAASRR